MDEINKRIKREICMTTLSELSDEKLMDEYRKCDSVKNEIRKLKNILDKHVEEKIAHHAI